MRTISNRPPSSRLGAGTRIPLRALGALGVLLLSSTAALAATDCSQRNSYPASSGAHAQLVGSGVSISTMQTSYSASYWGGCSGFGSFMPDVCAGSDCDGKNPDIEITVELIPGESTNNRGSCGRFTPVITYDSNGNASMTGGTIEIWAQERGTGVTCDTSDTLAHELGHFFGLSDANTTDCLGHIMGPRDGNQDRSVADDDCQIGRDTWRTPSESTTDPDKPRDDGPCAV